MAEYKAKSYKFQEQSIQVKDIRQKSIEKHQIKWNKIPWWHPQDGSEIRHYYNAWTDGNDIILLYKDKTGIKNKEYVKGFEWYFFITKKDYEKKTKEFWETLIKKWQYPYKIIKEIKPDFLYPEKYYRVYCEKWVKRPKEYQDYMEVGELGFISKTH